MLVETTHLTQVESPKPTIFRLQT